MVIRESTVAEAAAADLIASANQPADAHGPLSVKSKVLFAFGDTMDGFNSTAIATFHLFYLTAVCGLSGSLTGASLFLALTDALRMDEFSGLRARMKEFFEPGGFAVWQ